MSQFEFVVKAHGSCLRQARDQQSEEYEGLMKHVCFGMKLWTAAIWIDIGISEAVKQTRRFCAERAISAEYLQLYKPTHRQ